MPEELNFLAWSRVEDSEIQLRRALAEFDGMYHGVKTCVNIPMPIKMWPEILRVAMHEFNVDVGEVGASYIESLKGMNALRPFSAKEFDSFGGKNAFVKAVYASGCDQNQVIWAVPWRTDTRVIFYRRDLFAKAGIDEKTAFATPHKMRETLAAVQDTGIETPLALATNAPQALATFTACWVWGAGGDYISSDGTNVIFDTPEAINGFVEYFRLGSYLAPIAQNLDISASDRLFCEGKAAVTYAGTWLPDAIDDKTYPKIRQNIGVALPPGVTIVGGTHLVIWKRSTKVERALDLIRFLTSKETLVKYPKTICGPARLDALNDDVYTHNVMYQKFNEAIQTGRSASSAPLWGVIEDRLGKTLLQVWQKIQSQPVRDIETLVAESICQLASRLRSSNNS